MKGDLTHQLSRLQDILDQLKLNKEQLAKETSIGRRNSLLKLEAMLEGKLNAQAKGVMGSIEGSISLVTYTRPNDTKVYQKYFCASAADLEKLFAITKQIYITNITEIDTKTYVKIVSK